MMPIKEWLIKNGYTDPVEQVMSPRQGYLRAIRELKRKIHEREIYDETLPLMLQTLNVVRLGLLVEQEKQDELRLEVRQDMRDQEYSDDLGGEDDE